MWNSEDQVRKKITLGRRLFVFGLINKMGIMETSDDADARAVSYNMEIEQETLGDLQLVSGSDFGFGENPPKRR